MDNERDNIAKLITILDYFSFFCLVGLFVERENEHVKFHTNQGLLLAIIELCGAVIFPILKFLPIVGGVFYVLNILFVAVCLLFSLLGIMHAIREEKAPLPLIGTVFRIIR